MCGKPPPQPSRPTAPTSNYSFNQAHRPTAVSSTLTAIGAPTRDSAANHVQRESVQLYGLPQYDVGGHLIGHQFGGVDRLYNLVPMAARLNNHEWLAVETRWSDIIRGGATVNLSILIYYPPATSGSLFNNRPVAFQIFWTASNEPNITNRIDLRNA